MLDLLLIPVSILYLLVLSALFIYGVNFFYLTYLTLRRRRGEALPPPAPEEWPSVTVQLPVYNEMYVAERLIRAAGELDYPRDQLHIQVLDDSTDETVEIVARTVAEMRARGVNVTHLHRTNRDGFKAGALREGLKRAETEFLAIFDADFMPTPQFLQQTIPHFQDEGISFVQARWGHLNREYSFLTLLQSLAIDAHFMVEQFGRSIGGFWFNFNGTAGVWRKSAIEDAGGWKADTLTEDLDLSYRANLRGWRAIYLREVEVPAELPVAISAFRRQQHRWAHGSFECALRLIPRIWSAEVPLTRKLQATLHLSGYGVHLLMASLAILYPVLLYVSTRFPEITALFGIAFIFNATAFAPTLLFAVGQAQLGRSWKRQLPTLLFLSFAGAGMMVNTIRAALHIVFRTQNSFQRTPKYGITERKQDWTNRRYVLGVDSIVFFEIAFAIYNLGTAVYALSISNWVVAVYASIFAVGLLFISGATLAQSFTGKRRRARLAKAEAIHPPQVRVAASLETRPRGGLGNGFKAPNSLEDAILHTVAYADVFDYPLTLPEIHRYLIGREASLAKVDDLVHNGLMHSGRLQSERSYFFLPGRRELVEQRARRAAHAKALWRQALRYGRWIAHLPFVRMVAVTGALTSDNVEDGADLDYLIITRPGYLWLCRAFVLLLTRLTAPFGARICPNYLLTSDVLELEEHDLFTAQELARMVPLSGLDLYRQMRALNPWAGEYLPNAADAPHYEYLIEPRTKPLQRLGEYLLGSGLGPRLERWERDRKIRWLSGQVNGEDAEVRFSPNKCKGHFEHHGGHTMQAFSERLEKIKT